VRLAGLPCLALSRDETENMGVTKLERSYAQSADDWSSVHRLGADLISERTRAGVKAAKNRGVKFGRKRKLAPHQIEQARKLKIPYL